MQTLRNISDELTKNNMSLDLRVKVITPDGTILDIEQVSFVTTRGETCILLHEERRKWPD